MNETKKLIAKIDKKRRVPGWLIAILIAAALFLTGAICCNTIG